MAHELAMLLLAAGSSRRFGRDKLSERIGPDTLLERSAKCLQQASDAPLYIARRPDSAPLAWCDPTKILHCPGAELGLGYTISKAVAQLLPLGVERLLIALADQPQISAEDYRQLLRFQRQLNDTVCCQYQHTVGVPAVFVQRHFHWLTELGGDRGAKALLHELPHQQRMTMASAAVDIDTPQQLAQYIDANSIGD